MDFCPNPNRSRRLMRVPQASESLRTLFCRRGPRDFALFYVEMADFACDRTFWFSAYFTAESLVFAHMASKSSFWVKIFNRPKIVISASRMHFLKTWRIIKLFRMIWGIQKKYFWDVGMRTSGTKVALKLHENCENIQIGLCSNMWLYVGLHRNLEHDFVKFGFYD